MLTSIAATHAAVVLAAEPAVNPLPVPNWVYGATALTVFMVLLAITWAFRSVGNKH